MVKYEVFSLDMWGHVSADCTDHDCPCVSTDEEGNATHDDDRCDCHEDMNDRFRTLSIEVPDSPTDEQILDALGEWHLSEHGRKVASIDDANGMGEDLAVVDTEGRMLFTLTKAEG